MLRKASTVLTCLLDLGYTSHCVYADMIRYAIEFISSILFIHKNPVLLKYVNITCLMLKGSPVFLGVSLTRGVDLDPVLAVPEESLSEAAKEEVEELPRSCNNRWSPQKPWGFPWFP